MNLRTTVPQSRVLAGFERNLHQVREGSIVAVVVLAIAMVKAAHSNPMLDTRGGPALRDSSAAWLRWILGSITPPISPRLPA
jgi:hypothetical protein